MGFSISHKNGFEKKSENGHREENTINKNKNTTSLLKHLSISNSKLDVQDAGEKDKNEEEKRLQTEKNYRLCFSGFQAYREYERL